MSGGEAVTPFPGRLPCPDLEDPTLALELDARLHDFALGDEQAAEFAQLDRTLRFWGHARARQHGLVSESQGPNSARVLHVRNAPSPAATSSLAIAKLVVDRAVADFAIKA